MSEAPDYGEGWSLAEGRLHYPIDKKAAASRLTKGKRIAAVLPTKEGVSIRVEHCPSRDYLKVTVEGFPEDPRNRCGLRYERGGDGVRLAEISVFFEVPDKVHGDRAFWNQFVYFRPSGSRRAVLDLPAGGTRLIKSLEASAVAAEIAALDFALPDIDGYGDLVRMDLVLKAMLPLEDFDPSHPDVRMVRPDDHPPKPRRSP
jgi:hypothetical protein